MKVAIWGAGKMGQVHGQAYKGMGKDVEIAYIVERDAGKAAEFSGRFQCRAIDDVSGLEGKHIDMMTYAFQRICTGRPLSGPWTYVTIYSAKSRYA